MNMQTSIGQPSAFGIGPFAANRAESSSPPNASTPSTSSATVTANDFLQLLVTEMKNQDPTANTDPNEYINQLVQVNSLEQLVQINQDLGGSSPANSTGSTSASSSHAPLTAAAVNSAGEKASPNGAPTGNLSLPSTSGAGTQLANALESSAQSSTPVIQNLIHRPASQMK